MNNHGTVTYDSKRHCNNNGDGDDDDHNQHHRHRHHHEDAQQDQQEEEGGHPLVKVIATPTGPKCPFGTSIEFTIQPGGCVCLRGPSGRGKTTIATILANLDGGDCYGNYSYSSCWGRSMKDNNDDHRYIQSKLQMNVSCEWDPSIPIQERCGVLFQQTTLLDELTIAGNLAVALDHATIHRDPTTTTTTMTKKTAIRDRKIKQLLDAVGLDYDRDASKRPTELSGGMGRRACLAVQLAQHKRVIVLDEPFTGLDYDAAVGVARELVHLRCTRGTALLLISHEPHLTKLVMDESRTRHNHIVDLTPPPVLSGSANGETATKKTRPSLFGTRFQDRFVERVMDYTLYSFPLIALAFVACGMAIAMLSADLLQRLEISGRVLELVEKEVKPLIKLLTGEDATVIQMMGIRFKVQHMLKQTVPPAKATLYAIGLTKLFVLEVGPLLTALLLCGRIGGAYAGKVGTMQATNQNKLLKTLGINPQWWTLWPSLLAALVAAPMLTISGTSIALYLGGRVGPMYGIGTEEQYNRDVFDTLLPELRIRCLEGLWNTDWMNDDNSIGSSSVMRIVAMTWHTLSKGSFNISVTYTDHPTWMDTVVELATYPPFYHLLKAKVFIVIIMTVAEVVPRTQPNLTPRGVPAVITISVVMAGLLIILADWGFSQLWLMRN